MKTRTTAKLLPTQQELKEIFDYDPDSGSFSRKYDGLFGHIWSERGCSCWCIDVGVERYKVHRLIWKWMTGEEPLDIDHINGDGLDNSWKNLRSVLPLINVSNRIKGRNNTSGHVGVDFHKRSNKWRSRVMFKGKLKDIGYYDCPTAAFIYRLSWINKHIPKQYTKRHIS